MSNLFRNRLSDGSSIEDPSHNILSPVAAFRSEK